MEITKTPQKVLFVITKSNWGGAQKYVYTLATHASKNPAFIVSVLTGNTGELNERLTAESIHNESLPIQNNLRLLGFLFEVGTMVSYFKKHNPDIVHANSNKAGIVVGLASVIHNLTSSKKIGRKIYSVFTIHGHAFNEDKSILAKLYITIAELCIFILVDCIICVSNKVFKDIPFAFLFKKKSTVIYNGLAELSYLDKETARQKLNITNSKVPHFVTIAELSDTKNHVYLLRALSKYTKPFMYHIIGTGKEESIIKEFIHSHNISEKVILHGHLTDAHTYLKAFDLFILPSKTEALAYVVQEAGQAGIKTIASNVGGLPELLSKENLFSLSNPKELTALLENMDTIVPHTTYFKEEDMVKKTFELYRR